ncbi:MAG: hypothetical protein MUO85_07110, partial [candidate division Zixibacteria bacterium]|nr:hypothetical protein [candidate division Zixibacteria bacterium]
MSFSSKFVKHITYPLWLLKHGEFGVLKCIKEFDKLQCFSKEKLEDLQWERIKDILRHAYQNSPFHKQLFERNGISSDEIKDLNDFERIPIISKQEIRENFPSILARNFSPKELLKSSTGGSTGTPLTFYRDKRCLLYRRAIDVVFNRWLGVEIGDWTGWGWGASQDIRGKKTLKDRLASHIFPAVPYYRAFFLHYENITSQSINIFINDIKLKKPKLVVAYPNMIYQVARYIKEKKIEDVFVPSIVCTAEALFPHQRELVELT